MSEDFTIEQVSKRSLAGPVLAALVAAALALFIIQNTDSTPVKWLWIDGSAPLWMVIFGAALAGAVLSEVLGWIVRRARKSR